MTELKPCPFCGGVAHHSWRKGVWREHHAIHCVSKGCPGSWWLEQVGSCFRTEEDATTAWNRRVSDRKDRS